MELRFTDEPTYIVNSARVANRWRERAATAVVQLSNRAVATQAPSILQALTDALDRVFEVFGYNEFVATEKRLRVERFFKIESKEALDVSYAGAGLTMTTECEAILRIGDKEFKGMASGSGFEEQFIRAYCEAITLLRGYLAESHPR